MRLVIASLLLLGASSCAKHGEADYQKLLDASTLAMRRGALDAAQVLAEQGVTLTGVQPDSEWAWRFTLQLAEVRIRKHELAEARGVLRSAPPAGAAFDLARARREFLQGYELLLEGKRREAADAIERARRLAPESAAADDLRLDIQVLDGVTALQLGQRERGESQLNDVLRAALRRNDRYHQAVALLDLGYSQLVQKRYDAALSWLEQVLALTDLSDLTIYADALNNAGFCYSSLGQFERAVTAQLRAVKLHEGGARREYEQALGQLGVTYILRDDVRTSLPYLERALAVSTEAGLREDAALWAGNLSSAHIDLGDWDHAERFNDEGKRLKEGNPVSALAYNTLNSAHIAEGRGALAEAGRLFDRALSDSASDPSVQWSAHEGLARVALASGRTVDATRHFEVALQTIEKTRSDLMKTEYKLSYLTRLISFYRAYVDALVDQRRIERALEIADSSRGRVLAERQGVSSPARLRPGSLRRLAAESGTVFLSYWLAPARSYLWVVTPARVQLFTLPPAKDIESLVRQHQATIDNVLSDPLTSANTPGDRLFELLVQPALSSIPRGSRMLIVPDASLYALNFETLPVGHLQTSAGPHYLIEDFEIAVAPSLAMLSARPPPAAAAAARSLLLIGNATARAPDYPSLKFAGAEMTSVARHFPAERVTSYQGERAVPAAYRAARPDQFSYVHFTAHATANLDSPLDSAVILSGPDTAFKLYARDVAALPLHAELVTVSACRSAGERTYSGEGLVGFAWAFLRGGARRVVAGLWDVDDRSTAELMDNLYAGLAAGEPAGKALRAAKLTLLHRGGPTDKPYYWAPFELFTLSP
jgi:CHAT domain-containing protein/tetratricopeptide (TPR) repeat protein